MLAVGAFAAVPTGPVPPAEIAGGPSSPPPTPLPLGLQYAASETLGAADPVYAMAVDGSGFALSNATNVYTARVDAGGFSVDAGADSWSLTVAGVGYGGATTPLGSGVTTASATANRVEYDYGAISQWFVNGPMGLQQGFTLDQRPAGAGAGDPLTIELAQGGSLVATADPSGTSVTLTRVDGSSSLVYGGLIAYDADGSAVPARMSAEGGKLSILVDDADAVYPLTIDPYVQQARVVGSPAKPSQFFGTAVAMASSGTIAAISATGPSTGTVAGSVYIFTTDGTSWTRRGELTSSDGVPGDDFGVSLAMSADASTLVVGARNVTVGGRPYQGAAYVYRINPTAGTGVQIAKLTAQGGATGDSFGVSTAVNAKGSIIVIGAPQADVGGNVDQGAAYVFAANSPTSFVPAATLTAFDGTAGTLYGYSVAVDATGTIVAAGAPSAVGPNGAQGAVYAYRQGAATKLTANDAAAGDSLGYSVALNHDGTFLLAGAPQVDAGGNVDQGAAYVFTRSWNSWAQTAKLTSLTAGGDKFGSAVAIDPTASTAVVATSLETVDGKPGAGAAYVFERGTGGAWGQPAAARLVASDAVPYARLGYSVAIANGTVLAGAPFTAPSGGVTSQGAAYFFRDPPTFAVTVNPSSLTAVAGVPVTFGASSSGPDARTVRWQVNTDGVNWNDVPGATETWYTLTPTTADSGNRYRAIFTAAGVGSVTTTSATLTVVKATPVLSITSDANPRRIGDPLSITVAIVGAGVAADFGVPSGSVTVSLQRDGSADAPITFGPATLVDGKIIVPGIPTLAVATYTVTATYTGDASFAAATATTSQVVVRGTTTLTASVPASAAVGSRALLTMTLTAHGGLDDMSGGIVVKDGGEPIGYPQTTTVGGVTSATFLTPPLTAGNHYYQFMFLGNPQIQASSTGVYVMSVGGSGASSMAASAIPSQPVGDGFGTTAGVTASAAATSFSANAGVPATLTAAATTVVPRFVQWQYRDQIGSDDQYWVNVIDANSAWYTFTPNAAMQGRQYRAVFTDLVGNYEASPVTTLNVTSGMTIRVSTSTNPRRLGDPLTVTAVATVAAPGVGPITAGTMTVAVRREGSSNVLMSYSGTPTNGIGGFQIPTTLGVGSYVVTATYSNPTFGIVSANTSQVVVRGTTTLNASVPASAAVGSRVLLTMTLTAHGGLDDMSGGIVVKDGGEPIGYPQTTTVGGVTSATFLTPPLTAGNHYYQFMFLGNPQIQASSTGVYVMSVGGSGASSMAASASPSQAGSRSTAAAAPAVATPPAVDGVALAGAFTDAAAKKTRTSSALSFWRSGPR